MATLDGLTRLPVDPSGGAAYPVPIRRQWDSNDGYCGEASLVAAGMSFGQYTSQYTARHLASPGFSQAQSDSQLLLGVNDLKAAEAMKLDAVAYAPALPGKSQVSSNFYAWIRQNFTRGYRVIIGLYIKGLKDAEYDHIVPVLGVDADARRPVMSQDKRAGGITFSDNYGNVLHGLNRSFVNTRSRANRQQAPAYSLPDTRVNFGLAITGIRDRDRVTIPVSLSASRADEPVMREGANEPPLPEALKLRVNVSIPDQNLAYRVYYYNDFSRVPDRAFNAGASSALQSWTIPPNSGSSVAFELNVLTSDTAIFRAVPELSA